MLIKGSLRRGNGREAHTQAGPINYCRDGRHRNGIFQRGTRERCNRFDSITADEIA
jgi:hypothetical protein